MARPRGIKQRHPLGSVASRTGISPLTVVAVQTASTGVKISELPAGSSANDTDQLEVNQGGTSRRVTLDQLSTLVADSDAVHDQMGLVNAKWHGATGDGTTDDTEAIQAALDTGHAVFLPKGEYLVTDMLSMPYGGGLFGETKHFSKIIVPATFNLSALGVVRFAQEDGSHTGNEQSGTIKDITIEFDQPDTAVRASLVHYPPAIYAISSGRYVIENIRLLRAWTGLWSVGNSGGVWIDGFEACCFNMAMWMDDVLDCPRIRRVHLFTFDLTANQQTVFKDGTTVGIKLGRVDGLILSDFFAIYIPKALWFITGLAAGGLSFGNLTNVMLDDAGMVVENGEWNVSSLYLAPGAVTARSLIVSADSTNYAFVNVSSLFQRILSTHASGTAETIYVGSANGLSLLNISGMTSKSYALDRTNIAVETPGAYTGALIITGGHFWRFADLTATKPTIHVRSNGYASLVNIVASGKGTGTGDLIKVETDNWVLINNVTALGWTINLPNNTRYIDQDTFAVRQTYTPVVTAQTGTLTAYTATGRYTAHGKFLKLELYITITTNGTGGTGIVVTLPSSYTGAAWQVLPGREVSSTGNLLQAVSSPTSPYLIINTYNNAYPAANGYTLVISGEMEIA